MSLQIHTVKAVQVIFQKNKKNFMASFYGWGSIVSRLQPLHGGSSKIRMNQFKTLALKLSQKICHMKEQKHQNLHQKLKFYFMIVFKVEEDTANNSYKTNILQHITGM